MLKVSHVENAGYACRGRGRVDEGGASHLGSLADLGFRSKIYFRITIFRGAR